MCCRDSRTRDGSGSEGASIRRIDRILGLVRLLNSHKENFYLILENRGIRASLGTDSKFQFGTK